MKKLFISAIVIALLSLVAASCKSEAERIKEFNQEYERKRNEELKKEKEESLWILEQIHIIDNEYQPMSERRLAIIRLEMKYPDAFKEYRCKYEYNSEKGIFENINYIKCKIDSIRRYSPSN